MPDFYLWLLPDYNDDDRRSIEYSVVKAPSVYFAYRTFLDNNPSCTNEPVAIGVWREDGNPVIIHPEQPTKEN